MRTRSAKLAEPPPFKVSDHALIRWLERVHDMPMEFYRDMLASEVRGAIGCGAAGLRKGGYHYIIDTQKRQLITVVKEG